jgi:hypothetical protein
MLQNDWFRKNTVNAVLILGLAIATDRLKTALASAPINDRLYESI